MVDTAETLLPQAMHEKCASQKSQRGTKASSWESRSPQQNTTALPGANGMERRQMEALHSLASLCDDVNKGTKGNGS